MHRGGNGTLRSRAMVQWSLRYRYFQRFRVRYPTTAGKGGSYEYACLLLRFMQLSFLRRVYIPLGITTSPWRAILWWATLYTWRAYIQFGLSVRHWCLFRVLLFGGAVTFPQWKFHVKFDAFRKVKNKFPWLLKHPPFGPFCTPLSSRVKWHFLPLQKGAKR